MPETICCNYPSHRVERILQHNYSYHSCHYGHRDYDRNHQSTDIRPPSKSRATKWRDCIFLSIFFFPTLFIFNHDTRCGPDRPFDRDIVLESAGIILTYIFPDSASCAMVDAGRHGEIFVRGGQFLKIKRPTLSLRAAINNNGRDRARASAYLL